MTNNHHNDEDELKPIPDQKLNFINEKSGLLSTALNSLNKDKVKQKNMIQMFSRVKFKSTKNLM